MSTYSTLHGTLTLDAQAAAAFAETDSWEWCDPSSPAEDLLVTVAGDGGLSMDLQGGLYRNLSRYLAVDLVRAQRHGAVHGTLTEDCTDGGNGRTVTRYDGRRAVTGSTECFFEPVAAAAAVIVNLIAPTEDRSGFDILTADPDGGEAVTLHGAEPIDACGCAGWDDDTDEPVCAKNSTSPA
jgi:hypothetical protein